jgi:hypothetical protein
LQKDGQQLQVRKRASAKAPPARAAKKSAGKA